MKKIIFTVVAVSITVAALMFASTSSNKRVVTPAAEPTVLVSTTSTTVTALTPVPVPVVNTTAPVSKPVVSKPIPVVKPALVVVTNTTIPPVVVPTTQLAPVVNTTTTTTTTSFPVLTTTTTTTTTTSTTIMYVPRYIACHVDVQTAPTMYDAINFNQKNWPNGFVFPGPMTQQQCQDFGKAWADHMGYRFVPGGTFTYDRVT